MTLWEFLENTILYQILLLLWILFAWKYYLNHRQISLMKRLVDRPPIVENIMSKEVYDKARTYALDRKNFDNISEIFQKIITTAFLLVFYDRHAWTWGQDLVEFLGLNRDSEIAVSCAYMTIVDTVSVVLEMPFKVYDTFFLEARHGFNKQTPFFFVKDQLLKFVVLHALMLPFLVGMIWIIQNGGDYFFLYLWIFSLFATLFLMIIYPEVIAPLFDKYSPLPEGDLKEKIEALAASVEFPLYKLFIVEGSKRSSHSNAYMYGFHKHKRIVLFDTLVKEYYKPDKDDKNEAKGCETDEVLAVLAHEIGHWKFGHTLKGFFLAEIHFLVMIILYAKLLHFKPMYEAFGFYDSQPVIIGLIIVTVYYILIPVNTIMHVIMVVMGRRFEFQADKFAQTLGHGAPLKKALIKLHMDNLGYPLFDKLYTSWHHNHPPLLERLEAIDKAE